MSSAFSTSLASISATLGLIDSGKQDSVQRLARAEVLCLTAEASFLTLGLVKLGKLGRPLTHPPLGLIFWPITVGLGMIAPLILQLTGPARGRPSSRARRGLTSMLVLVGGFSLRALMIFAGRRSANSPEDYFELTRKR
jgi:formate-dependent nitrite reductase membrane component NrfD